jgi:ankyrin repeat protein
MNAKFHPALKAIQDDDLETFKSLIAADPSLATSRSTRSHPTLLQAVVLDGKGKANNVEMARVLIDAAAELNEPLIAAGSIDNRAVAELLLDHGAAIDGTGGWSPLEEALYWNNQNVLSLLLERGAKVQNLRVAAGLGRTDLIESYFDADGTLKPEAGKIDWPFGGLEKIACSNHDAAGKQVLADRINSWSQDQQGIVNNAFVYACMHSHIDAATLLLNKGAEINVIPGGFDYAGTGLHYAALNGHRAMVEFLLAHGADRNLKDTKVGSTAAGWAEYGGHPELRDLLSCE